VKQNGIIKIFFLGNTWSDKMSNQKRIGLKERPRTYAGCSRIIATIQRASSTELPAESDEKRRRAVPVKVRPFCASKQQKNALFIDSKPTSENREGCRMTYAIIWAEWVGHADASMRPHAA
jgi:hypothetical protein